MGEEVPIVLVKGHTPFEVLHWVAGRGRTPLDQPLWACMAQHRPWPDEGKMQGLNR